MRVFRRKLPEHQANSGGRQWFFMPYDQLSDSIGPLAREDPKTLGIVLVENPWKAARRPYHKQKLALVLANLWHFALEQAARGVAVRHLVARGPYRKPLEPLVSELGTMRMMAPAERELRADLQPLVDAGRLELFPHEGWLNTHEEFRAGAGDGPPWRMDVFYRYVRRKKGILMEGAKPIGGKYSFDRENRLPWRGNPRPPASSTFPLDPVKEEVGRLIESQFGAHPVRLDLSTLPATPADADALWSWAKRKCLPIFGPYEDAMSVQSTSLFHTRISSLVNIHRLLPVRVTGDVISMDLPLSSKEDFIRQVLGCREFFHHVYVVTEGFREIPAGNSPVASEPGVGGYSQWAGRHWTSRKLRGDPDGGHNCPFSEATGRFHPHNGGKNRVSPAWIMSSQMFGGKGIAITSRGS